MIDREKFAGAAEAGLNLVGDEQRAVFAAKRLRAEEIIVGGDVDALALNRFDEEGRDLARGERALQRGQIVERNLLRIRQQRAEALLEDRVAVHRQRAIGEAVEGVRAMQMPARPVAARANLIAASIDSAPELAKNTLSR